MIWCVAVNVMFIEKQCWTDEMFSEQSIEECWWLTYWAVLMLWRRTAPNHCLQYVFVFHVLLCVLKCCCLCEDWERWLPEEVCWNLRAVMRSGAVSPISRRTNQPFRWSFLECWKHRDLEFCLSLVCCGGSIVVSQPAVSAVVCSCVGHYARVELCVVEFCASKFWPGRGRGHSLRGAVPAGDGRVCVVTVYPDRPPLKDTSCFMASWWRLLWCWGCRELGFSACEEILRTGYVPQRMPLRRLWTSVQAAHQAYDDCEDGARAAISKYFDLKNNWSRPVQLMHR